MQVGGKGRETQGRRVRWSNKNTNEELNQGGANEAEEAQVGKKKKTGRKKERPYPHTHRRTEEL